MNRRQSLKLMATALTIAALDQRTLLAHTGKKPRMVVYKSPTCGCCGKWVQHVRDAGYDVQTVDVDDVTPYKTKYGVPYELASCHTGVVEGYAIEGHVPADLIDRLLKERPKNARALAVPGMPLGSPGMEVPGRKDAYDVILIDTKGRRSVFAKR
jgi:hypothetical protein